MGGGHWDAKAYDNYTKCTYSVDATTFASGSYSSQEIFTAHRVADELRPYNVMRECCDSDEHPNSFPVILALDVTGSMGHTAVEVAQKLNEIMTTLYEDKDVQDVEFCIMAVGDLACDDEPIQISQFESDVRIADQLGKVYFEYGGGGNTFESYTAAWYMGARHCALDCWNRGGKGVIITMGDECPNPYLPHGRLNRLTGDTLEKDVDSVELLNEVRKKYDVYHIAVDDYTYRRHKEDYNCDGKWRELLGQNYFTENLDSIAARIIEIIKTAYKGESIFTPRVNENNEIVW